MSGLRVRFQIIGNARIENVGKSQSCMVSKLPIIWKQTVLRTTAAVCELVGVHSGKATAVPDHDRPRGVELSNRGSRLLRDAGAAGEIKPENAPVPALRGLPADRMAPRFAAAVAYPRRVAANGAATGGARAAAAARACAGCVRPRAYHDGR